MLALGLGIGITITRGGGPVSGVSLTAPVLTWVSAADDNTPLFEGVFTDLQVDDLGRLQISDDVGFTSPIEATNTADAAEVLALQLDYTSGALADGQWWARVRHERGASVSDWSNVETETISTTSAEVQQYLDRATGMDATHVNAFTALIDGLVADDVWDDLDALYILATDTEAHAKLNLKGTSFAITETGAVTFTADQGYTQTDSDGTNYLSTGFNPSTAGGVYTQNSAHFSIWCNTNQTSAVANFGAINGVDRSSLAIRTGSDTLVAGINQAAGSNLTISSITDARGHVIVSRTGSGAFAVYKNGASIGTDTDASQAPINLTFQLGGRNFTGTFSSSAGQYSAASIGAGLDATKADALYDRIAAYRTAVGL